MPFHDGLRAQRTAALGALILVTACGGVAGPPPADAVGSLPAGSSEPKKPPPLEELQVGFNDALQEDEPPPPEPAPTLETEAEPAVAQLAAEAARPDKERDGAVDPRRQSAARAGAADPLASADRGRGQVRGATATASGVGLSPDVIRNVIRQSIPRFNACYRKELAKKPELGGAMVTGFTINAKGTVSEVQVTQSNLQNAELTACVVDVVRSLQFPPPEGGGTIQVRYPLTMSPEDP